MVNNSRGWGGAEELMLSLSTELRARGRFVGIFLREGGAPAEKLSKIDFPVWAAKRNAVNYLIYILKLAKVVRREKIDLIHLHRIHDVPVAFFAGLAAGGVPLLLTQHTHIGKANYLMTKMVNRVAAVSGYIEKGILKRFSHMKDKIVVVHNGTQIMDYSEIEPDYWLKRSGLDAEGPFLGTVGFFYKKQEELIDLLPSIRSVFPSVLLIIIGEGTNHQKSILEEKVASLGMKKSVYFAGQIPHDEMHKALGALDLNLSAYKREPFGLHVIEGMVSGTPFVGYQAGGFPEIVEHGRSGYLAESREELLESVISVLQDRKRLHSMSKNGRERVERKFSIQEMVTKYESIYSELVGGPE